MLLFSIWTDIIKPILDGLVSQFINGVSSGLPKVLSALIIFWVGLLIARFARRIISKLLNALGFDKFTGKLNEIDLIKNSGIDVLVSDLIARIVHFIIVFLFIMMAVDVLQVEAISQLMKDAFDYMPSLLTASVILVLGLFLADLLKGITLAALQSMGIPSAKIIAGAIFYFLFVTIAISALTQAKIETAFISANLTAIIGAGALAFAIGYGIASKDLASNYLGSYYNRNKIRVNDEVIIDNHRGKVVLIDHTSLILQTEDRAIIIPLSKLTTGSIQVLYPAPQAHQKRIEEPPSEA